MKKFLLFLALLIFINPAIADVSDNIEPDIPAMIMSANLAYSDKEYEKALSYYNKILYYRPQSFYVNGQIGKIYLEHYKNPEQAIKYLTEAIKYYEIARKEHNVKVSSEYYVARGDARFKLRDYDGSIKDLTKAIEIDKNLTDVSQLYLYRALNYLALNDYKHTIEDTTEAIKLRPKFPNAFYVRGLAKLSMYKKLRSVSGVQSAIQDLTYAKEQALQLSDMNEYKSALKTLDLARRVLNEIR